ncbi:ABC transporter ATP-binding protein [Longivirga aurantiaca]|uniref:ABC transporter ATP-binding protein n=1 Tax=Longivirga aurantiaca TaxID=1837743 RepID=A0ABW1SYP4_9ACTN
MTRIVSAESLRYEPAGRVVLDDVSVRAEAGEMLAVTGPSGSGKSSLLALLAGLAVPSAGRALVDGRPVLDGLDARLGLVLQGYGLVSVLTAAENVEVALQALDVPAADVRSRALEALVSVGLGDLAERSVEELSGGQRQRVAVARALVTEPDVVLADEPTSQQDGGTKLRILALLRDAADRGAVVLVATHDPEVVAACDRETALHDGRLVV